MHFPILSSLLEDLQRRGGSIEHEQFFTNDKVASHVAAVIKAQPWFKSMTTFIEPSAGAGAILKHFPGAKGFDLVPQADGIEQSDFLQSTHKTDSTRTLVFGNPPFGRAGSLAAKFIIHASKFADHIAFILPATFAKAGIQARMPKDLHLVHEEDLPLDSFVSPEGVSLKVRCVFQIWERKSEERKDRKFDPAASKIQFVKPGEADFAVRRIGDKTLGKIVPVEDAVPTSSFFFLKGDRDVQDAVRASRWDHIKGTSAKGLRSISRQEFADAVGKNL